MMTLFLYICSVLAMAGTPTNLEVVAPPNNGGLNLEISWQAADDEGAGTTGYMLLRSKAAAGPYDLATGALPPGTTDVQDKITTDIWKDPPAEAYYYRVVALQETGPPPPEADASHEEKRAYAAALLDGPGVTPAVKGVPVATFFSVTPGHFALLAVIVVVGLLMAYFTAQAQRGHEIFIRRIPGIDAIEEGIGRATEMGRPVLYVPGIDELQDIQTIASMLILGQVSKTIAEYQADIIVSCCIPIVREVADEVVKAGFYQAGHPDAYSPSDVRFISPEQFAFTAGTNGIIHREKPATNLYLGRFFAESLILAETGFVNGSIQIAGTAEATQLPFFIAACDYTLIGEELFAVSAYLSGDPRLVSSLKASDYIKIMVIVALVLGSLEVTFLGSNIIVQLFTPVGEG